MIDIYGITCFVFKRSQVEVNELCISVPRGCFNFQANNADPDVIQHFIWFFTVCQSTRLGVSSIQKVNNTGCKIVCVAHVTYRSKSYLEELKVAPNIFLDSNQIL